MPRAPPKNPRRLYAIRTRRRVRGASVASCLRLSLSTWHLRRRVLTDNPLSQLHSSGEHTASMRSCAHPKAQAQLEEIGSQLPEKRLPETVPQRWVRVGSTDSRGSAAADALHNGPPFAFRAPPQPRASPAHTRRLERPRGLWEAPESRKQATQHTARTAEERPSPGRRQGRSVRVGRRWLLRAPGAFWAASGWALGYGRRASAGRATVSGSSVADRARVRPARGLVATLPSGPSRRGRRPGTGGGSGR